MPTTWGAGPGFFAFSNLITEREVHDNQETIEAKTSFLRDLLEVSLEDLRFVGLENVFQYVMQKIGTCEWDAKKGGKITQRH